MAGETDAIANMANVAAALKEAFGWWWVGFYIVKERGDGRWKMGEGSGKWEEGTQTSHISPPTSELVLGPFQGPVACTRIALGKGVCGAAWQQAKTIIVPDVDLFPGHIACSGASRSEIVVPLFHRPHPNPSPRENLSRQSGRGNTVIGVLDVDSEHLNHFDEVDKDWLERVASLEFGG